MKYSFTAYALTAAVAIAPTLLGGTRKDAGAPVVITPPAVANGSNAARAPFPAARPQNDVTPPNGEAFDQNMAPNTPSTTPDPVAPPPATIAILQPRTQTPGLMPTGRMSTGAAAALDVQTMDATMRSATFETRDQFVHDIRSRVRQSHDAMSSFRRTEREMSAEGRAQFQAAAEEVKTREKALDRSIRAVEKATAATWDSARAQLAADYDAYAAALARVDAAAGITPVR